MRGSKAYRSSVVARQREPGWYAYPGSPGQWRWWDGGSWTEHSVSADPKADPATRGGGGAEGGQPGEPAGTVAGGVGAGVDVEAGPPLPPGAAGDGDQPAGAPLPLGPPTLSGPIAGPVAGRRAGPTVADETRASKVLTVPAEPGEATTQLPTTGATRSSSSSGRGTPNGPGTGVFARRWAALVGLVVLVFVVLAIVLRGHSPAFYWEGEPMANAPHVLAEAQAAMRATASADEGVVSPQSNCYFSLPNRSAHDVAPYIRCGPVFLPWSAPADAWLTYRLRASPTSSGVKLSVASSSSPPAATVALAKGEVLRRPGGGAPASRDAGLSPPAVPRQRPGWTGVLKSPPTGLEPAPVGDLIGDWGRSYRLVAFGEVGWLPSRLGQPAVATPSTRRAARMPAGPPAMGDRRRRCCCRPGARCLR